MFKVKLDPVAVLLLRERIPQKHLYVSPSKLSAICGLNKWQSVGEAAADMLSHFFDKLEIPGAILDVTECLIYLEYAPGRPRDKLALISAARTMQELQEGALGLRGHSHISPRIYGDEAVCDRYYRELLFISSDEEPEPTVEPSPPSPPSPPAPQGPTVAELTARAKETEANTSLGVARETADLLAAGITEGAQQRFREQIRGDFPVHLTGFIDGIQPHDKYPMGVIVESKRRVRGFRGVPLEEQVQMEAYMELQRLAAARLDESMPTARYCIHLENFEAKSSKTRYRANPNLQHRIRRGLEDFLIRLAALFATSETLPVENGALVLPLRHECDAILENYKEKCEWKPIRLPLKLI